MEIKKCWVTLQIGHVADGPAVSLEPASRFRGKRMCNALREKNPGGWWLQREQDSIPPFVLFFKKYIPTFETGTAALRKEIISTCTGVTEDLISGSLWAVLIEAEPRK